MEGEREPSCTSLSAPRWRQISRGMKSSLGQKVVPRPLFRAAEVFVPQGLLCQISFASRILSPRRLLPPRKRHSPSGRIMPSPQIMRSALTLSAPLFRTAVAAVGPPRIFETNLRRICLYARAPPMTRSWAGTGTRAWMVGASGIAKVPTAPRGSGVWAAVMGSPTAALLGRALSSSASRVWGKGRSTCTVAPRIRQRFWASRARPLRQTLQRLAGFLQPSPSRH